MSIKQKKPGTVIAATSVINSSQNTNAIMTRSIHPTNSSDTSTNEEPDPMEGKTLVPSSDVWEIKKKIKEAMKGGHPMKGGHKKTEEGTRVNYGWWVLILTIVSVILRFWLIQDPHEVVFDEVHFGKFASFYLRRSNFFDVHPPLGKMMIAAMGFLNHYNGSFLFEEIGLDYYKVEVPYVALRALPAMCGALIVPLIFMIMLEMKHGICSALIAAGLALFDNALITQSKFILLDSMLLLFTLCALYAWIRFYGLRSKPFSGSWWQWLVLTGIGMNFAFSIKMVGLFMVSVIGIETLRDLWLLLDIRMKLSMFGYAKHFMARVACLIVLPIGLYLLWFYCHFAILNQSGPGDAFMSPGFLASLQNNQLAKNPPVLAHNSIVTIKHKLTNAYLHSHNHTYPLQYTDGRISSQGQQVTLYAHKDENNVWRIELYNATEQDFKEARYLRNGDLVRLFHITTKCFLYAHDVASPLLPTHEEVTCNTKNNGFDIWRVDILQASEKSEWKILTQKFRLVHVETKVVLHAHNARLPEWAYNQLEVNGNKNKFEENNEWIVEEHSNPSLPPHNPELLELPSFWKKFKELQMLMLRHNSKLIDDTHPFSSKPEDWPILSRGISFWSDKKDRIIYLLGNPMTWWISFAGIIAYGTIFLCDALRTRRGFQDIPNDLRQRFHHSGYLFFLCWAFHYLPFFIMVRVRFLHHYLPALLFSYCITGVVFDFIFSFFPRQRILRLVTTVFILSILAITFIYFAPLTYGLGLLKEQRYARKWISSWDFIL